MSLNVRILERSNPALDFAPELLAIQDRPPAPMPRAVLYLLLALFSIMLGWAVFGRLDIVTTASGKLVPKTSVKIVQPADSGVIKELLVDEGDRVQAGQVLVRLDTTFVNADAAIAAKEVEVRSLQLRRIGAELSGHPMARRDGDSSDRFLEVDAQAQARAIAYQDAIRTERAILAQAEQEIAGARAQVVKLEKLLPMFAEEEASLKDLAAQGFVTRIQFSQKQRERIDAEQNLEAQRRTVNSLAARIDEARGRISRVSSDYRQQLLTERVEAQSALERARQEAAKQDHRETLSELRAPQDGVIKDVATSTVGAVVTAGTVLMNLVPIEDELVAEVLIKNEDVGFIYEGQAVKVKLATFPFQKYGMLDGTVKRIAADAHQPQQGEPLPAVDDGGPGLSPYKAMVLLKHQRLQSGSRDWPLAPGMQVVAEMNEGTRTVIEYLLSPVRKVSSEAMRER